MKYIITKSTLIIYEDDTILKFSSEDDNFELAKSLAKEKDFISLKIMHKKPIKQFVYNYVKSNKITKMVDGRYNINGLSIQLSEDLVDLIEGYMNLC